MKVIPVQDAVGMVLCHDITQIIPGRFKGPAFRKGHVLREEDVPQLLVWARNTSMPGNCQVASCMKMKPRCAWLGPPPEKDSLFSDPKEGKVDLLAEWDGLLKIDVEALYEINEVAQIVFATLHSNQGVVQGQAGGGPASFR